MVLQPGGWFSSLRCLAKSPGFIWINGLTLGMLGALGLYASLAHKTKGFAAMFRDPFSGGPIHHGLFTNFSEVVWCVALGICLFCFGLLRSLDRRYDWFLLATAGVIAMLLFDDLQRISLRLMYGPGIPKGVMYGLYMLVIAAYAHGFRRRILRDTPYPILLITVAMFLISALSDVGGNANRLPGRFALLEDGTKLLGLMNLVLYCWWVGQQEVQRLFRQIKAQTYPGAIAHAGAVEPEPGSLNPTPASRAGTDRP